MHGIYAEAFGCLIVGHSPRNENRPAGDAAGTVERSLLSVDPAQRSEGTRVVAGSQPMPSRNLLRDVDELCIRNLTLAVARGEPLQPQLDAAIAAFESTYGERPDLSPRPARAEAA